MSRTFAKPLLAACLALPALAWAQAPAAPAPPAKAIDKLQYAQGGMLVLVAPEYPKAPMARGEMAIVTVTGTIQTDGRLEDLRIEAEAPNDTFAAATREVARLWRLQPRIVTPQCGATESPGRVTLWFEIEQGQPKVSYGVQHPPEVPGADPIHKDRAPIKSVAPQYPAKLAADPNVPKTMMQIAYVGVSAAGDVINVTLAPVLYYREFEPLIVLALRQWKYAPQPKAWCGEVVFHMTLE